MKETEKSEEAEVVITVAFRGRFDNRPAVNIGTATVNQLLIAGKVLEHLYDLQVMAHDAQQMENQLRMAELVQGGMRRQQ